METGDIIFLAIFVASAISFIAFISYSQENEELVGRTICNAFSVFIKKEDKTTKLYLDRLRAIQNRSEGRIEELDLATKETQDSLIITSCRIEACRNENEFNNDCA